MAPLHTHLPISFLLFIFCFGNACGERERERERERGCIHWAWLVWDSVLYLFNYACVSICGSCRWLWISKCLISECVRGMSCHQRREGQAEFVCCLFALSFYSYYIPPLGLCCCSVQAQLMQLPNLRKHDPRYSHTVRSLHLCNIVWNWALLGSVSVLMLAADVPFETSNARQRAGVSVFFVECQAFRSSSRFPRGE